MKKLENKCRLCPRECGVPRNNNKGYCKSGDKIKVAKAMLHRWEEPPISGSAGSGAIFFSGCALKCVFCQNHQISHGNFGQEISIERLGEIMLSLQEKGAHNINLVNPTHFSDKIINSLDSIKKELKIPVVYNCGGYEKTETLKSLKGYIDIYLPDFKYFSPGLSKKYSGAEDYFSVASRAIEEMINQTGEIVLKNGIMQKGVIIRHMVLPMCYEDSLNILDFIAKTYPENGFLISLMSQYTPMHRAGEFKEINRKITSFEYGKVCKKAQELGLNGFFQERSAAKEEYTPIFDLSGI